MSAEARTGAAEFARYGRDAMFFGRLFFGGHGGRTGVGRPRSRWRMELLCVAALGGLVLAMLIPWGCTPTDMGQAIPLEGRVLRVRLLQGVEQVSISASQPPLYFTSSDATQRYLDLPRGANVPVTFGNGAFRAAGTILPRGELTIQPTASGSVAINGVAYRGRFRLVPTGPLRFDVINDVDVDEYLMGVISRELFPGWHEQTYRAQAIAARTYALYEKHVPREPRHWDVYADQRSQVYGGVPAETAKSREAVEATRGIVLAYGPPGGEKLFKAYFSSCCGGVTQAVCDAFPGEPFIPPLSAQKVGPLCSASPRFNWGPVVIMKDELTRRLRAWGAARNRPEKDIGLVHSVEIAARNAHGRPVRYTVTDARGLRYSMACEDFRWAVNYSAADGNTLSSSYVESVINESDRIRFVGGHGYGHGVGLCQWCAEARARAGVLAEDILMYAYPGAVLVRAY